MRMLIFVMLILSGCEGMPVKGDTTRTACQVFRPITYSATQDTPETVQQVRGHNAAYASLCKQ